MVARKPSQPPATTPEARENQLIMLAYDAAERMLLSDNPPAQIVTHLLKAGGRDTAQERLKRDQEIALLTARVNNIDQAARSEEVAARALAAMTRYQGRDETDDQIIL